MDDVQVMMIKIDITIHNKKNNSNLFLIIRSILSDLRTTHWTKSAKRLDCLYSIPPLVSCAILNYNNLIQYIDTRGIQHCEYQASVGLIYFILASCDHLSQNMLYLLLLTFSFVMYWVLIDTSKFSIELQSHHKRFMYTRLPKNDYDWFFKCLWHYAVMLCGFVLACPNIMSVNITLFA